jgi:cysteinyl-tRNA synthetase
VDQIARSRRRLDADDPSTMIGEVLRAGDPALMRAAMVRLGESLQRAEGDRERLLEPLIEMLLELRRQAREEGDYTLADDIRDRLGRLGVSLADEPDGSTRFEVG